MTDNKVKLILGSHGAGKSEWIFRKFFDVAYKDGKLDFSKKLYLVVPEQDTNDKQRKMMHKANEYIGTTGILNIDVTSFTRIAHDVFDKLNIELDREKVLEDDAKTMILTCLVSRLNDEGKIKYYKNSTKKVGFAKKFTEVVSEFYAYSIDKDNLDKIINSENNSSIKDKVSDLKLIYDSFITFLSEKGYKINEDRYNLLAEVIDKTNIFDNAIVAFDGFTGFTPVQLAIFNKIKEKASEVFVTIDTREPDKIINKQITKNGVFYLSEKFAKDVGYGEIIDLSKDASPKYKEKWDLGHIEKSLYNYHLKDRSIDKTPQDISLYVAKDVEEEVLNIIQIILNLIKNGEKYRDIKIIVPNIVDYQDKFISEFSKNNIPLFIDDTTTVLNSPYIEIIRAALDVVNYDFNYDSVMRYINSGIFEKNDDINSLDNIIREFGIRGYNRYKNGFTKEKIITGPEYNIEKVIEKKDEILNPLLNLYNKIKKGNKISVYIDAINAFINEINLNDKYNEFKSILDKKYIESSDYNRQKKILDMSYVVMKNAIKNLLIISKIDDSIYTNEEFKKMLDVGLTDKGVKSIPFGLDQIVVGDVMRSRFDNPKIQIFMGLNQSRFPKAMNDESILNDKMREIFAESNITLSQTTFETALNQRFYSYLIFTNPTEKLILSYTKKNADGNIDLESSILSEIKHLFNGKLQEISVDSSKFSFVNRDKFDIEEESIKDTVNPKLIDAIVKKHTISASTIESFNSCPYKHFLSRTLSLNERKEYGVNALDFGNFVHGVLEIIFSKYKNIKDLDDNKLAEIIRKTLDEVCEKENRFKELKGTNYFGINKINVIKENCFRVLFASMQLLKEVAKGSKFNDSAVEDPLTDFSVNGIKFVGRVDKIDTYITENDGEKQIYINITDYKSGKNQKTVELEDIESGVTIQLILYLDYYLNKYKEKGAISCGSFYFWITDPIENNGIGLNPAGDNEKEIAKRKLKEQYSGIVNDNDESIKVLNQNIEITRNKSGLNAGGIKSLVIPGVTKFSGEILDNQKYDELKNKVYTKVSETYNSIKNGNIDVKPYDKNNCRYCPFINICNKDYMINEEEK